MSKRDIKEDDDFEWDRGRCAIVLIAIVIIASFAWTAINMYQPSVTVQNVTYSMEVDNDVERFNTLHRTFFGGNPGFENVTLVVVNILVADIPDVNRMSISISSTLPTHLTAIILAEFQNENNILHGTSNIDPGQVNYAVTVSGGRMNLILYLFLENVSAGGYELIVRAYQAG